MAPLNAPQILICDQVLFAQDKLASLSESYRILHLDSSTRSHFFSTLLPGGSNATISAIYRTNSSADRIGIFDKELVQRLPESVKFVCHNGAGYDQIDVQACTERGIQVSNTAGAVDDATATTAMFLIIAAMRKFSFGEMEARRGNFKKNVGVGKDPEGKILGIIGMGGIGRALAKRALAFEMKIHYHNRTPLSATLLSAFPPNTITYHPTLATLLPLADVISLNLPLNSDTRNSFGKAQFDHMKKGAVLVNTARGGVCVEEDLMEALESGTLYSAGLDVFPSEPNISKELKENERITLLPHLGTATEETERKLECLVLENLESALGGRGLLTRVGEQRGMFS